MQGCECAHCRKHWLDEIQRARREERERCAKVAETAVLAVTTYDMTPTDLARRVGSNVAETIRALGDE